MDVGATILGIIILVAICHKLGFAGWRDHRKRENKPLHTDVVFVYKPCFICSTPILAPKGKEMQYTICHKCAFERKSYHEIGY